MNINFLFITRGKNCDEDIRECEAEPCQNNATCYELSDVNLYSAEVAAALPAGINDHFLQGFSYDRAAGYRCDCPRGFEGIMILFQASVIKCF